MAKITKTEDTIFIVTQLMFGLIKFICMLSVLMEGFGLKVVSWPAILIGLFLYVLVWIVARRKANAHKKRLAEEINQ